MSTTTTAAPPPPPQQQGQERQRQTTPDPEFISPHFQPQEISFPFPKSLHTTAHLHLTFLDTSTMVFITTTTPADGGSSGGGGAGSGSVKPMGSFVYAMPDRTSPRSTVSTTLHSSQGSVEYATRVAKILARLLNQPVYVGCSIDPTALGLMMVEEEMEGLKMIVDVVVERWEGRRRRV